MLQVEIGGHFPGQISQVLHDRGMRLAITKHPQAIEHLQAELMRRGDSGGIELSKRVRHPVAASLELLRLAGAE
jgi:hypothetical protein